MTKVYKEIHQFAKSLIQNWRKTQREMFLLLLCQIVLKKTICLTLLARAITKPKKKAIHQVKRLWRFLDNEKIDTNTIFVHQSTEALKFVQKTKVITIAVDWTYIGHSWAILAAGISFRNRWIPIYVEVYPYGDLPTDQPTIERKFLKTLFKLINAHRSKDSFVLVADRGFTSSSLLQWLKKQKITFVIRCQSEFRVKIGEFNDAIKNFPLRPNDRYWFTNVLFCRSNPVKINLSLHWKAGCKEPWFIVTNLFSQNLTLFHYRRRMHIEEGFRDSKHVFDMSCFRYWSNPMHVLRMLAFLFLAFLFLTFIFLSKRLFYKKTKSQFVTFGKLSFLSLAIFWLEKLLTIEFSWSSL
jgi:hypothetical protein